MPLDDDVRERVVILLTEHRAELAKAADQISCCIICGARKQDHPLTIGVFFPTNEIAKRLGQPKNKTRQIVYGLCFDCIEQRGCNLRNTQIEVEEILLRTASVM
jgi:hypothetical protein